MTISPKGIALIKQFEGVHDGNPSTAIWEPKKDPVGLWTLGYGARYDLNGKEVTARTPGITSAQADQLLVRDIQIAELYIKKWVKKVLNQHQYDALCSFIYNVGPGNFQKSNLLKHINMGVVGCADFTNWSKARKNGTLVTLPGLLSRRNSEYALYTLIVSDH